MNRRLAILIGATLLLLAACSTTEAPSAEIPNAPGLDPLSLVTAVNEDQKLTASDAAAGDYFGYSVAVSGDTAIIGARFDDDGFSNAGSAYVFTRDTSTNTWTQTTKLTASDAASVGQAGFGWSVAVSDDTAVIGVPFDNDPENRAGSAYVFTRDTSTGEWSETAKLTASDAAFEDQFGWSVAVSGDTAVIGAYFNTNEETRTGSAYVFTRDLSTGEWSETAKLIAGDRAGGDYFGESVAVSGDTAIVGAPFNVNAGIRTGSAYVFTRTAGTWSESTKITASDAAAGGDFGFSVAVSGDTAVIGASRDDDNGSDSGSAYVFTRDTSTNTWTQATKLTAGDTAAGDRFGWSVALSGDKAVIGSRFDDPSGSAYLFTRTAGTWSETAKLTASDAAASDDFGFSVAVSGDTAFVGAPEDDDAGTSSGSVYVFTTGNELPVSSAGGPYNGNEGSAISLDSATATDGDGDPLTYSWSVDNPTQCTLSATNVLNPTLICANPGTFEVTLVANDGQNDSEPSKASVTVANLAPTVTITGPDTVVEGETVSYDITATDPGNDPEATLFLVQGTLPNCGSNASTFGYSFNSFDATTGDASGLLACTFSNGSGSTTLTFSVTDGIATTTAELEVIIGPVDTTAPIVTANIDGTLGDNGWYTSDVTVGWIVSDLESAVTATTGCAPTTLTSDTTGDTFTCTATSAGGSTTVSVTVKRDATPPAITAEPSGTPNSQGWYNEPGLRSEATDATSGVLSCNDATFREGRNQSASVGCTDVAGNSSVATVSGIDIDLTPPTVTVTGVTDGATYTEGEITPGCSTSDALSGVATEASISLSGGPIGEITATCDGALDVAGNAGDARVSYTVVPPDTDGDGVNDAIDNCPTTYNPDQGDNDSDTLGDACDPDDDNDGVNDIDDAFPFDPTETSDNDGDGTGDNADLDDDNDGQTDLDEIACGSDPLDAASTSPDNDEDGTPDCVDPDDDNDGVNDVDDVCAATSLTNDDPDSLKKNRFYVVESGDFIDGEGTFSGYTIADTGGCSSKQIIDAADLGAGHERFGITRSALEAWIASLP